MLRSWVWLPKLMQLVLSKPSADVQSIVQQPIVMERLSKLAIGKKKRMGEIGTPIDYYFSRGVRNL